MNNINNQTKAIDLVPTRENEQEARIAVEKAISEARQSHVYKVQPKQNRHLPHPTREDSQPKKNPA